MSDWLRFWPWTKLCLLSAIVSWLLRQHRRRLHHLHLENAYITALLYDASRIIYHCFQHVYGNKIAWINVWCTYCYKQLSTFSAAPLPLLLLHVSMCVCPLGFLGHGHCRQWYEYRYILPHWLDIGYRQLEFLIIYHFTYTLCQTSLSSVKYSNA